MNASDKDAPAVLPPTEVEAMRDYALGNDADESVRLCRQSEELRPEAEALLSAIDLKPGQAAIDVGCGPRGILGLLSAAVSPGGRVVGLDAHAAHVAMATRHAQAAGLSNVQVMIGDARHTGLAPDSFDLVHARTLLVTIPDPAQVVAEMGRLTKPGGWVASQEPDCEHAVCHPPLPAWERLREIFLTSIRRTGADPFLGRRLPEIYRQAGLEDVHVMIHAGTYPAGHTRRTVIADLVRVMQPAIIELGLADERELAELDRSVRQHLADPKTLMMPHLLAVAWGRKPHSADEEE